MVSSSSPSPSSIVKASFLVILMLALIGSSSVFAARAGPAASTIDHQLPVKPEMEDLKNQHRDRPEPTSGFRYRGMAFGFLPKGTPVPPSGPSPRHNSETNSTTED